MTFHVTFKLANEEVTRRDIAQTEAIALQSRVQDISDGSAFLVKPYM